MNLIRTLTFALALAAAASPALAGDTTLTYQGSLKDAGAPAAGTYQMTFQLWSAAAGGSMLGSQNLPTVQVADGRFTAELDFGANNFNNTDRWLEIIVEGTTLSPRQPITRAPYAIQTRGLTVDDAGQVAIGTAIPFEMLTIRDENANILLLSQGNNFGPKITFRNTASGTSSSHGTIYFDDGSPLAWMGYGKPLIGPDGLQLSNPAGVNMKITAAGLIGLGGELDPLAPLHLQTSDWSLTSAVTSGFDDIIVEDADAVLGLYSGPGGNRGSAITLGEVSGGALVDQWSMGRNTFGFGDAFYIKHGFDPFYGNNQTMFVIEPDGDVYIPSGGRLAVGKSNPQVTLDVAGTARVNVLEVLGADLAERFPVAASGVIEPGTVMEIDPENPGSLRVSKSAYSPLVAGVVSGAGGLPSGTIMGNIEVSKDGPAVALSGRVWVRCDTASGAIVPGDLLTTSSTPGCAMRVGDSALATGAVIGKAMTGLDAGGQGLVLVLVSLH
jgi:hypothetical protein